MGIKMRFQPSSLLSLLKASVWLIVIAGRIVGWSCAAQTVRLPSELNISAVSSHFCNSCFGNATPCGSDDPSLCTLCQQICTSDKQLLCRRDSSHGCDGSSYDTIICGYVDAVVCQHTGGGSYCVFQNCSDSGPFCTGSPPPQSNPDWTKDSCAGSSIHIITLILICSPAIIGISFFGILCIRSLLKDGCHQYCQTKRSAAPDSNEPQILITTDAEPEAQQEVYEQQVPGDLDYAYSNDCQLQAPTDQELGKTHTYTNVSSNGTKNALRPMRPGDVVPGTNHRGPLKNGIDDGKGSDTDTDDDNEYAKPSVSDDDELEYTYACDYPRRAPQGLKLEGQHRAKDGEKTSVSSADGQSEIEHQYFNRHNMPSDSLCAKEGTQKASTHAYMNVKIDAHGNKSHGWRTDKQERDIEHRGTLMNGIGRDASKGSDTDTDDDNYEYVKSSVSDDDELEYTYASDYPQRHPQGLQLEGQHRVRGGEKTSVSSADGQAEIEHQYFNRHNMPSEGNRAASSHAYTNVNPRGSPGASHGWWRNAKREPDIQNRGGHIGNGSDNDTDDDNEYVKPSVSDDELEYTYACDYRQRSPPVLQRGKQSRSLEEVRGNASETKRDHSGHKTSPSSPCVSVEKFEAPSSTGSRATPSYFKSKAQRNSPVPRDNVFTYEVVDLPI